MVTCGSQVGNSGWELSVPTFGNRQLLAMVTHGSQVGNQEFQALGTGRPVVPSNQSFLYWTIKQNKAFFLYWTIQQNKAFCTGPLSKTKRSVPVREAKQSVLYQCIKQNKAFCTGP